MTEHERYIQSLKKRSYYYSYGIGGGFAAAGLTLVCFGHFAPGAALLAVAPIGFAIGWIFR